jgi:hypothetical protein
MRLYVYTHLCEKVPPVYRLNEARNGVAPGTDTAREPDTTN